MNTSLLKDKTEAEDVAYNHSYGKVLEDYYFDTYDDNKNMEIGPQDIATEAYNRGYRVDPGESYENWHNRHKIDRFVQGSLERAPVFEKERANAAIRQKNLEEMSSVERGLKQGAYSMAGGLAGGLPMLVGKLATLPTLGEQNQLSQFLGKVGLNIYEPLMEKASLYGTTEFFDPNTEDLSINPALTENPENIPTFILESIGTAAPSMAVALGSWLTGGAMAATSAGSSFLSKGIANRFVNSLAKKSLRKGIVGTTADEIVDGVVKRTAKEVSEEMARKYAEKTIGGRVGAWFGTATLETTGNFAETVSHLNQKYLEAGVPEEEAFLHAYDEASATLAIVTGSASAFLETATGNIPLLEKISGPQTARAAKEFIKLAQDSRATPEIIKKALTGLQRLFKDVAKNAAEEFTQESAQELLSLLNVDFADPDFDMLEVKNLRGALAAGVVGGIAGGAFAGGGKAFEGARSAYKGEKKATAVSEAKKYNTQAALQREYAKNNPEEAEAVLAEAEEAEAERDELLKYAVAENSGVSYADAVKEIQEKAPNKTGKKFTTRALRKLIADEKTPLKNVVDIDGNEVRGTLDKESLAEFIQMRTGEPAAAEAKAESAVFTKPAESATAAQEAADTSEEVAPATRRVDLDQGMDSEVFGQEMDQGKIQDANWQRASEDGSFATPAAMAKARQFADEAEKSGLAQDFEAEYRAGLDMQTISKRMAQKHGDPTLTPKKLQAIVVNRGLSRDEKTGLITSTEPDNYSPEERADRAMRGRTRIMEAVEARFGSGALDTFVKHGLLRMGETSVGAAAEYDTNTEGATFNPIALANATDQEVLTAVYHEIGAHHGIEAIVAKSIGGKESWAKFKKQLKSTVLKELKQGGAFKKMYDEVDELYVNNENATNRKIWDQIKDMKAEDRLDHDLFVHELLARAAGFKSWNGPKKAPSILSRLRDLIVNAFRRMGMTWNLTVEEMARLLEGSIQNILKTDNAGISPKALKEAVKEPVGMKTYAEAGEFRGLKKKKAPVGSTESIEMPPVKEGTETKETPAIKNERVDPSSYSMEGAPEKTRVDDGYPEQGSEEWIALSKEEKARITVERKYAALKAEREAWKDVPGTNRPAEKAKDAPLPSKNMDVDFGGVRTQFAQEEPVVKPPIRLDQKGKETVKITFPEETTPHPVKETQEEDVDRSVAPSERTAFKKDGEISGVEVPKTPQQILSDELEAEAQKDIKKIEALKARGQKIKKDAEVAQEGLEIKPFKMSQLPFNTRQGKLTKEQRAAIKTDFRYREAAAEALVAALKSGNIDSMTSVKLRDFFNVALEQMVALWNIDKAETEIVSQTANIYNNMYAVRSAFYSAKKAAIENNPEIARQLKDASAQLDYLFEIAKTLNHEKVETASLKQIQEIRKRAVRSMIYEEKRNDAYVAVRFLDARDRSVPVDVTKIAKPSYMSYNGTIKWYEASLNHAIENIEKKKNEAQRELPDDAKLLIANMLTTVFTDAIFTEALSEDEALAFKEALEIYTEGDISINSDGVIDADYVDYLEEMFKPLIKLGQKESDMSELNKGLLKELRRRFKDALEVRSSIIRLGTTGVSQSGGKIGFKATGDINVTLDGGIDSFIANTYRYIFNNIITNISSHNQRINSALFEYWDVYKETLLGRKLERRSSNKVSNLEVAEHEESAELLVKAIQDAGLEIPLHSFPVIPTEVVNGKRQSVLVTYRDWFRKVNKTYDRYMQEIDQLGELDQIEDEQERQNLMRELAEKQAYISKYNRIIGLSEGEFIIGMVGVGHSHALTGDLRFMYEDMPQDMFDRLNKAGMTIVVSEEDAQFIMNPEFNSKKPRNQQRALWRGVGSFHENSPLRELAVRPLVAGTRLMSNARVATFLTERMVPAATDRESDPQFKSLRSLVPGAILYNQKEDEYYIIGPRRKRDGDSIQYSLFKVKDWKEHKKTGEVAHKMEEEFVTLEDIKDLSIVPRIWDMFTGKSNKVVNEDGSVTYTFTGFDEYKILESMKKANIRENLEALSHRTGVNLTTAKYAVKIEDAFGNAGLALVTQGRRPVVLRAVQDPFSSSERKEQELLDMAVKVISDAIHDVGLKIKVHGTFNEVMIEDMMKEAYEFATLALERLRMEKRLTHEHVFKFWGLIDTFTSTVLSKEYLEKIRSHAEDYVFDEGGGRPGMVDAASMMMYAISKSGAMKDIAGRALIVKNNEESEESFQSNINLDGFFVNEEIDESDDDVVIDQVFEDRLEQGNLGVAVAESSREQADALIALPYKFSFDPTSIKRVHDYLRSEMLRLREEMDRTTNKKKLKRLEGQLKNVTRSLRETSTISFARDLQRLQKEEHERLSKKRASFSQRVRSLILDPFFKVQKSFVRQENFTFKPLADIFSTEQMAVFNELIRLKEKQKVGDKVVDASFYSSAYDDENDHMLITEITIDDIENMYNGHYGNYIARQFLTALYLAPDHVIRGDFKTTKLAARIALADSLQGLMVYKKDGSLAKFSELSDVDQKAVFYMMGKTQWYKEVLDIYARRIGKEVKIKDLEVLSDVLSDKELEIKRDSELEGIARSLGYFGSRIEAGTIRNAFGIPVTEELDALDFIHSISSGYIHPEYSALITGRSVREAKADAVMFSRHLRKAQSQAKPMISRANELADYLKNNDLSPDAVAEATMRILGLYPKESRQKKDVVEYVDEQEFNAALDNEIAERFIQRAKLQDPGNDKDRLADLARAAEAALDEAKDPSKAATIVSEVFAGYKFLERDLLDVARQIDEESFSGVETFANNYEVVKPISDITDITSFTSADGTLYIKMSIMDLVDGEQPRLSINMFTPSTADMALANILNWVIPGYFGKIEGGGAKTNPNYTTAVKVAGENIYPIPDTFVTSFGHEIMARLSHLHNLALENPRILGFEVSERIRSVWDATIQKAWGSKVLERVRKDTNRQHMYRGGFRTRQPGSPVHKLKKNVDTKALEKHAMELVNGLEFLEGVELPQIKVIQADESPSLYETKIHPDVIAAMRFENRDFRRQIAESYGFVGKDGTIYIFAGNHATQDGSFDMHEFMKTVFHAIVGHVGLKAVLGEDYRSFMLDLFNTHAKKNWGKEEIRQTDDMKIAFAEEIVATMIEDIRYSETAQRYVNPNSGTIVDKIATMIVNLFRKIMTKLGFKSESRNISAFEVRDLISRALAGSSVSGRTGFSRLIHPSLIPGEQLTEYSAFGNMRMNAADMLLHYSQSNLRIWELLEKSKTAFGKKLDHAVETYNSVMLSNPAMRFKEVTMDFLNSMKTMRSRIAEFSRRAAEYERKFIESFEGKPYDQTHVAELAKALHAVDRLEEVISRGRMKLFDSLEKKGKLSKKAIFQRLENFENKIRNGKKTNNRATDASMYADITMTDAKAIIEYYIQAGWLTRDKDGNYGGMMWEQVEMLHAASNQAMRIARASGLMSQADLERYRQTYQVYVSIPGRSRYGFMSEAGLVVSGAGRFGRNTAGLPAGYRPADVIGATFAGLRMRIVEAELNKTTREVFNFFLFNPNREVARLYVPEAAINLLVETGKIKNDAEAIRTYMEENGLRFIDESVANMPLAKLKEYEVQNNLQPVYIDGQLCHMEIVHKQLNHSFGLHMNPSRPGRTMRTLAKINRWLITCATMASPEFWLGNLVMRDPGMALGILASKEVVSGISGREMAKNVGKLIGPALRYLFAKNFGKDASKIGEKYALFEKYHKVFLAAGGKIQWAMQESSIETMQSIAKGVRLVQGGGTRAEKTMQAGGKVLEAMRSISDAFENATRFAVFVASMESGAKTSDAAVLAREITVDFDRKGELGTFVNTLYMFANAGIQANVNIARTIKNNPRKAAEVLGATISVSFALAVMNFIIGGDGEDGEPWYDGIPQETRNSHLVIIVPFSGGHAIKIPFPYGFGFFWSIGQELASMIFGRNGVGDATAGILSSLMNNFNPLETAAGLGDAHGWARMISPTITDPLVDIYHEQTPFGTPLMPEARYEGQPDSQRHWRSVTGVSKAIAQTLNEWTMGNSATPGFIDISPETLDLMYESMTGGLGKFLARTTSLIFSPVSGKQITPNDIPLLRRFTSEQQMWIDRGRFKSNYEEIAGIYATFQNLNVAISAAEDPDLRRRAMRDREDFVKENKHILSLRKVANATYNSAKIIDGLKERLYKSGRSAKDIASEIEKLNKRQADVYRRFNFRYFNIVDNG